MARAQEHARSEPGTWEPRNKAMTETRSRLGLNQEMATREQGKGIVQVLAKSVLGEHGKIESRSRQGAKKQESTNR